VHTALICVLIAGLMPYLWGITSKVTGPRYDNADVRGWQSQLTGLPQRAHAAHLNSLEAFPLFAAAVISAMAAVAEPNRVMQLSVAFIGLRLAYGAVYLLNLATIRSFVWFAELACAVGIFFSALSALGTT